MRAVLTRRICRHRLEGVLLLTRAHELSSHLCRNYQTPSQLGAYPCSPTVTMDGWEEDVAWQPLSVRVGTREPDGPYEGVPAHLRGVLRSWLNYVFSGIADSGDMLMLENVIMRVRAPVTDDRDWRELSENLLDACSRDEQLYLDVLDACLHFMPNWNASSADSLRVHLAQGGSVWTVSPDNKSLQRAVEPQVQAAFELATSPADAASDELAEAWGKAYGRSPDPSDAWDHSIKAVEASLRSIVCPNDTNATLGRIIGILNSQRTAVGAHAPRTRP